MRYQHGQIDPIDEILRQQPSWEAPPGFARRVAARAHRGYTAARDWQPWLQALERGALAGLGVYATAVVWQAAAPVVLMNVTMAGWIAAPLALAWGGYASRSLFSRI